MTALLPLGRQAASTAADKLRGGLGTIEEGFAFLVFVAMGIVVFLQFFTRYVLNDSLGWTEEIARYLLIATSYVGAVLSVRRGTEIRIEIMQKIVGRTVTGFVDRFLVLPISCVCYSWLALVGWDLAMRTRRSMTMIDLPMTTLYWPVVGCLFLMALHALWRIAVGGTASGKP